MPKYATGKHALAISDRSGLQFPWKEMVTEWTGAFVHTSEYEPKQPQLRPKTLSADSMSLTKVRPARTAFPTPTILPNNPFTTEVGTTVTVTDASAFPSSGYIYVQTKPTAAQTRAGDNTFTLSEVIKYTGKSTNTLTGLTRGSSAPTYGLTPQASTAGAHSDLDKVFGSYSITPINITVNYPGQPSTKTVSNQYTFVLASAATSATTAGGFPSFAGPVGDRP